MSKNQRYPSSLRDRAEFLQRTVTVEHGITKERWEPAFACWCEVQPLSGREFWKAAALNRENEVRFVIRYRGGVLPEMRIRLNDVTYNITSIIDRDHRHRALEILARTVMEDGKCEG